MATHKESIAYVSTFNDLAGDKVQFTQSDYKFYEVTANSNFDSPAIFVSNAIKDNLSNLKSEYDNPEKKKIKSKCTIL